MKILSGVGVAILAMLPSLALAQAPPVTYTPPASPLGNVATATALAANGANCSAGNYPLGVDASGASESCTAAVSAAGAAARCALFTGATSLTSDSGCTYAGTGATFALTVPALVLSGYEERAESAAPGTPTNGIRFYTDTSNRNCWVGESGFARCFDGTANTAARTYVLPDVAGTMVVGSAFGNVMCGSASTACSLDAPATAGVTDFNFAFTPTGSVDTAVSMDFANDFAAADTPFVIRDNGTTNLVRVFGDGSVVATGGMTAGASSTLTVNSRLRIGASADGAATITNNGATDLDTVTLGPATPADTGAITIASQNSGPAGVVITSSTVASGGVDVAITHKIVGDMGAADFAYKLLDNATTQVLAVTGDATLILGAATGGTNQVGAVFPGAVLFAALSGSATNGQMVYCSDCLQVAVCAGVGAGAIAKRLNGAWVCN